ETAISSCQIQRNRTRDRGSLGVWPDVRDRRAIAAIAAPCDEVVGTRGGRPAPASGCRRLAASTPAPRPEAAVLYQPPGRASRRPLAIGRTVKLLVLGAGLQGGAAAFDMLRNPDVERVGLADVSATRLDQARTRLDDRRLAVHEIDLGDA